jgi:colanic acid biosynthesis glycosyl transferase WcaI
LRIISHDYAGYAFPLDLSSQLAIRGHEVLHLHFAGLQTPKGTFETSADKRLTVRGLYTAKPLDKTKLLTRYLREREYGQLIASEIRRFRPDAVLSADTPLDTQETIMRACCDVGARFYFWMQDFYSLALRRLLPKRVPIVGTLIGRYYEKRERSQLKRSDGVVFITSDFLDIAASWGLTPKRCHVIENWAPLEQITPLSQDNDWSRAKGLAGKRVLLYSGTLGMKHNPKLIWHLAERTQHLVDVDVVVISSSPGVDYLKARAQATPLRNLHIFETQPFADLPNILATGAILITILEPAAGTFSVPSKTLSYLCAGRPLICAIPSGNLAARIVTRAGAGVVVDPSNQDALADAALQLLSDGEVRLRMGAAARIYAMAAFDGAVIAAQFEKILSGASAIWQTHEQRTVTSDFV